jgi:hypothetical protein
LIINDLQNNLRRFLRRLFRKTLILSDGYSSAGPDRRPVQAGGILDKDGVQSGLFCTRDLPCGSVVEGGAEIGFSGSRTKNNFRPPAGEG